MLIRPPEDVMAGHILRVLEGPLAPITCASRTNYTPCKDCADEETCAIRLTMLEVREAITSVLDAKSLADMRKIQTPALRETVGL